MLFLKSTLFLSFASAVFTTATDPQNNIIVERRGKPRRKLSKNSKSSKCITKSQCAGTVDAFSKAVIDISTAYWKDTGAGEAENPLKMGTKNKKGCEKAYEEAIGALRAAYDYQGGKGKVLFKPTYSSAPYTYRPTKAGALSYFIGTECMILADKNTLVFPDGNEDGSIFQESGFGTNNGPNKTQWIAYEQQDFMYQTGGEQCETALATGRICFTAVGSPPTVGCVDKTFSFVKAERGNPLPAVLSSHHSSQSVTTNTLTSCQDAGGIAPDVINPKKDVCE